MEAKMRSIKGTIDSERRRRCTLKDEWSGMGEEMKGKQRERQRQCLARPGGAELKIQKKGCWTQ